jgi:2-polyprenyl-3-methyl-5-hydroxy-6-metoxy-1,4-benzoquinol methylase
MKQFLISRLIDPYSAEELSLSNNNDFLKTPTGNIYVIKDDIAVMMDASRQTSGNGTNLHKNFNSNFDYIKHYETDAVQFDYFNDKEPTITKNERKRSRQAIINAVPKNTVSILDIGCGSGWLAEHFLQHGKQIVSSDISNINPAKALANFPHQNHAAIVCDAFNLPFKNNSFDCIVASEVIEHVFNPSLFISSLLQKIKPGGALILITPYNEKIEYFLCVHCNKPTPKNAHLHSFSEKNIKSFFTPTTVKIHTDAFCNKYFLKLRMYNLLSFLPYRLWKVVDRLANKIVKKPTTFLIKTVKA